VRYVILVLNKITYCNIHTTSIRDWKNSRAFKILIAGHMWSVGP